MDIFVQQTKTFGLHLKKIDEEEVESLNNTFLA